VSRVLAEWDAEEIAILTEAVDRAYGRRAGPQRLVDVRRKLRQLSLEIAFAERQAMLAEERVAALAASLGFKKAS
jgi:hypothetical protein